MDGLKVVDRITNMKIKGQLYPSAAIKNRLHQHFKKCSRAEINQGKAWYNNANEFAAGLSAKYELPIEVICGVIAALSPQKDWELNKVCTVSFFNGNKKGLSTKINVNKAIEIRDTKDINDIPSILLGKYDGFKTHAFYHNLSKPKGCDHVTLDRHAIGLAFFSDYTTYDRIRLTKAQYNYIQDNYKAVAAFYGLLPHELQAILWIYWRNLGGLRDHNEVPF